MLEQLERAYAAGDHRALRTLARRALTQDERRAELAAGTPELARARELLDIASPDPFLGVVGVLGLGLMAFLVYNYVP